MATIQINGAALECTEVGEGELVVLVHGSSSDHRTWKAPQEGLAKRYRVLAYSRRFHWPNRPIDNGADDSMQAQLDDLAALLRSRSGGPVHLIGHSCGAFLALAEPPVITLFVSNKPKPGELIKLLFSRPRTAAAIVKFGAAT